TELHKKILSGEITISTLVAEYESRARADTRNIYREVFSDIDVQVARAEAMLKAGEATMFTGIPVAIKDNIMFAGHIAGSSSKMLEHHTASYNSTVVQQLINAGAIIIGRTNMDECAMGSSTENSAYGPTLNPLDETRVPGGSSGGSAAALPADVAVITLGSDTGGSIRQPAAFCGVVGLSPTYGSVSRHGLISMGSSLDVIGPLAKTVEDAEIIYNTIAVKDAFDSTSVARPESATVLKKKLAIPKGLFTNGGCDVEVQSNFEMMVEKFKAEGYTVDEVDLPHFGDSLAVYYILMPAEVSSNLARLDGIRYGDRLGGRASVDGARHDSAESGSLSDVYTQTRGQLFGKEVRRRILLGTYVLSHGYYDAYYNKAVALRGVIRRELETVLADYDAIITPTTPTTAFKFGEKSGDPLAMYLSDLFTVPANIAHLPALSVPSGKDSKEMPFSIQFIGAQFSEPTLFTLGKTVENIR
ncbi:Asp-tRNA(Asn)/Glu-tRNA(Gln) amidotransferase subunit GatA, partial [Patescibacteria group bacterium]|nr:Asp-tRNA(Asn)/Glu-tRNA(Gln) amidotransferase subunit GatA [Patescibacteria group bacterium]